VVAAGVDSVSHAHLLAYQTTPDELTAYQSKPPLDADRVVAGDPAILELLAEMRSRGTVLDATASLWARIAAETGEPEARQRAAANDAISAALTRQAIDAGVTVSAGTDRDPDLTDPWPPLYDELDYLVERCGMTPAEALRAASHAGALSIGALADMGTVEPGKLANFAVFDADPAQDLAALRTVTAVVKRGRHHARADYRHPQPAPAGPAAASTDPQPENGAPRA
ncbi:amidohydrolase family protein, partial [Actinospica sp. MGRD01-02]